jgi:hypothetical protein
MTRFVSPAASALWAGIPNDRPLAFGPLALSRHVDGIEIRNGLDAGVDSSGLRCLPASDLRAVAQVDALGRFRPNKASPGLVRGWFHRVTDTESLETALDDLLPGGLADWHALRTGSATPVRWQDFVDRQTGMYRNVSSLAEPEAELVARAGCHPDCCTRRRRWTVGNRPPEPEFGKSEVPCLEPCALVLELARRTAKAVTSEERSHVTLAQGDLAILDLLLESALRNPDPSVREGDLSALANPRRILLLRERLLPWLPNREWIGPD